jgi:hypothetical protein
MTQGVKFHRIEAKTVYRLATGEITWNTLNENEKHSIAWNPYFVKAIDNSPANIVPVLAFNRFIDYIRKGKVTFEESYYYQDIGKRIQNIEVTDNESYLTPDILEQLSEGTFPVDTNFLCDLSTTDIEASDDEVPPSWFSEHQQLFKMQTDDLFSMEYAEVDFAERLYNSIGFLGRNFRYRDSDTFMNLKYFIQRYISDATLRLELKFIHKCIEQITNRRIEGVVIDTMGVDARIKSILSTYHGRWPSTNVRVTKQQSISAVVHSYNRLIQKILSASFTVIDCCLVTRTFVLPLVRILYPYI